MMPTGSASSTMAGENSTYTLGIGAAGSEQTLMTRLCGSNSSEIVGHLTSQSLPLFWGDIPAGSRLAVKQSVGRTYRDVILYGVPA